MAKPTYSSKSTTLVLSHWRKGLFSSTTTYLAWTPIGNFSLIPSKGSFIHTFLSWYKPANYLIPCTPKDMMDVSDSKHAYKATKSIHFDNTHAQMFWLDNSLGSNDSEDEEDVPKNDLVSQSFVNSGEAAKDNLEVSNWPTACPFKRCAFQMVSLESVTWNNEQQLIEGHVLVHNASYEKKVKARYSFDDWKTFKDVQASYKESVFDSFYGITTLDRFVFYIKYDRYCDKCSMAIQYQVLGMEFWDNNSQDNFDVKLSNAKSVSWVLSGGNRHKLVGLSIISAIASGRAQEKESTEGEQPSIKVTTDDRYGVYYAANVGEHRFNI